MATKRAWRGGTRSSFRKKIPESRVAKPTQWLDVSTGCSPGVHHIPVGTTCGSTAAIPFRFDLVPASGPGAASDIIRVHSLDVKIHVLYEPGAFTVPPTMSVCETIEDEALESMHVRWGLVKYYYASLGVETPTFNQMDMFNNLNYIQKSRESPLMASGEIVKVPSSHVEYYVENLSDCVPVAGTSANGVGHAMTPQVSFHLRRSWRYPVALHENEGLGLYVAAKSVYSGAWLPFFLTSFGRMRVSFS